MLRLIKPIYVVAHASGLKQGDAWWWAWHFDALIVCNLSVITFVYVLGIYNLWVKVGFNRVVSTKRAMSYLTGTLAITLALLSPLDTIGNDLSWVHMLQHMVVMVVAAPLIMYGCPAFVIGWAFALPWRKRLLMSAFGTDFLLVREVRSLFWNPLLIWTIHAIGLWIWHLPFFYELALVDPLVHDLEHLTFFVIACLFWRLISDSRKRLTISPGAGVLYLFTTSIHSMFLGVFMALSPVAWYSIYEGRTERWGLTVLEDQQLAGSIMWMPACATYAIAAVLLLVNWLERLGSHVPVPPQQVETSTRC